ncbi:MAG: PilN domain-containing protein [Deltaproteobacteria bacterium]|nr:PilN domain-containing protein [Deltaproteobacteria bacterium]
MHDLNSNLTTLKVELKKIETKRDDLMRKPTKKKISVGQYQELLDKIESAPKWSKLLNDLSRRLPNTVWITTFKTANSTSTGTTTFAKNKKSFRKDAEKEAKEKAAAPIVRVHKLELNGVSSEMKSITELTTKLSDSKYFSKLTLTKSVKEAFGYSFTILSEIDSNVR